MSTNNAFRFCFCIPQHACMINSLKQFHPLLCEEQSGLCGICWNRSARDWSYQHLPNCNQTWCLLECYHISWLANVQGPPHKSRIAQKTLDVFLLCRCRSRCTNHAQPSSRTLENRMYWRHESSGRLTAGFLDEIASGPARLQAEHQLPHICVPNRKNRYSARSKVRWPVFLLTFVLS